MNALLHHDIFPSVSFQIDQPAHPAALACRAAGFDVTLAFERETLRFGLGGPHEGQARPFEIGLPPDHGSQTYHLVWEHTPEGRPLLVLKHGDALLVALECGFVFDPGYRLETTNITPLQIQRERSALNGLISAPDTRDTLVLVAAPTAYQRAVCGALEEHMPFGTHIYSLAETAEDAEAQRGPALLRSAFWAEIETKLQGQVGTVVLVGITNPEEMDTEEIPAVIEHCDTPQTQLFLGGFVQKLPLEQLADISTTQTPQLICSANLQPPLSFAAQTWSAGLSPALSKSFEWYVPQALKQLHTSGSEGLSLPKYSVSSPLWQVGQFWPVTAWAAPVDGAFTLSWVLHTLFAQNGHAPAQAIHALRETYARCRAQNIRVLGCHLQGADKPTYLLVDVALLALACDASYARSLRPLQDYISAIDHKACLTERFDTEDLSITLLHMATEDRAAEAEARGALMNSTAQALRLSQTRQPVAPTAAAYVQALGDVIATSALINALSHDQICDMDPEGLTRFLRTYPETAVYLCAHVVRHAPPSKILPFMQILSQASPRLSAPHRKELLRLLIETRIFPVSDEAFWESLPEQPYNERRWAALQVLEQLPTEAYLERAPKVLAKLDLLAEDHAFNQVLAALKTGDMAQAVALGQEAVLNRKLRPENERDMLAIALLAEEFDIAERLVAALAEPLPELDQTYHDGVLAARKGSFSEASRTRCTEEILALDADFVDLRVVGRRYDVLTDFETAPDPSRDVICVITAKNEESRLRETLAYHHSIGLRHFILIDNMSSDGTLDLARSYGAMIIQTAESYKESRYGMAWVNDVLDRHCTGFWTLVVDADEMFVYPDAENRPIQAFTALLEAAGYEAFGCALLDMYPDAPISSFTEVPRGELRALYRYFDAQNAAFWPRLRSPQLGLSGGVRDRAFRMGRFAHLAPIAQTKTPLVKWAKGMKYLTSTHDITPVRAPLYFGALEHYKYTPDFVQRAKREVIRKEHWGEGSEYTAYATVLEADPEMSFRDPNFSRERTTATELIKTVCPFPWPEDML